MLLSKDVAGLLGKLCRFKKKEIAQPFEELAPSPEFGVPAALGPMDDRSVDAGIIGKLPLGDAAFQPQFLEQGRCTAQGFLGVHTIYTSEPQKSSLMKGRAFLPGPTSADLGLLF